MLTDCKGKFEFLVIFGHFSKIHFTVTICYFIFVLNFVIFVILVNFGKNDKILTFFAKKTKKYIFYSLKMTNLITKNEKMTKNTKKYYFLLFFMIFFAKITECNAKNNIIFEYKKIYIFCIFLLFFNKFS